VSQLFQVRDTPLLGLRVLERSPALDDRGFLERLYELGELDPLIGEVQIAQVNRSRTTKRGTVRGLHYQAPPHAEAKLVTCLRGEVFDVAVDVRNGSPTFLQWHGELLSEVKHSTLVIPAGFAHGFQTLSDNSELLYLHSEPHVPSSEGAINPQDPRIAISWPEPIRLMSTRDASQAMLTDTYRGLTL
jgi:dTDP-4-dehydrorhamnose 3,5-epimerase